MTRPMARSLTMPTVPERGGGAVRDGDGQHKSDARPFRGHLTIPESGRWNRRTGSTSCSLTHLTRRSAMMAGPARQSVPMMHPALAEGLRGLPPRVLERRHFLRRREPADVRRPLVHVPGIRPRAGQPQRADTGSADHVLLVGAYAFQGILDLVRSRIVMRSASLLDEHLGGSVHAAVIAIAIQNPNARMPGNRSVISTRSVLS